MRLLFGTGGATIDLGGAQLNVDRLRENGYYLADKLSDCSAFLRDEIPVLLTLSALLGRADAFVDVGANIGVYSSIFSRIKLLNPELNIHSFEVDPETRSRLMLNAQRHGFQVHPTGVSDKPGKVTFHRGSVSHLTSMSAVPPAQQDSDCFEASMVRLDEMGWNYQRIVMKIDVEGFDHLVLRRRRRLVPQQSGLGGLSGLGLRQPERGGVIPDGSRNASDGRENPRRP